MRCDEIKELLWAYYAKDILSQEEKAEMESHLATCSECQKEAAEVEKIMEALHSLPEEELPDGYHKNLMEKLAQEAKVIPLPVKKKPQHRWKQLSLVAAAALVVVAVGGMQEIWQSSKPITGQIQEQEATNGLQTEAPIVVHDEGGTVAENTEPNLITEEKKQETSENVQQEIPAKTKQDIAAEQPKVQKKIEENSVQKAEDLPMVMSIADESTDGAVPEKSGRALRSATGGAMAEPKEVTTEAEVILTVESTEGVIQKIRDAAFDLDGYELYNAYKNAITISIPKEKTESFYETLKTYGEMRTLKENTETLERVTIAVTLEVNE